jgi:phosphoenolpyruvate-protein phosphotransferase (PTS system enzyme I)
MMRKLNGIAAAPGVGLGTAHLFGWRIDVHERHIARDEIAHELVRLSNAVTQSESQLQRVQQQIADEEGASHQSYQILEAHRLMLSDPHLVDEARRMIREDLFAAEWAVRIALDRIRAVFDRITDPYFRERGSDVEAVGERLLRSLQEADVSGQTEIPPGSIVYAHDLSPADMTQLGRMGVRGFVTESGGKTSHSAVVARALGLPLVVGVRGIADETRSGMRIIVDGSRGEIILNPDAEALAHYESRSARALKRDHSLSSLRGKRSETADGVRVDLAANIELLQEVPSAIELGASSVGLFRTEFLYLDRETLPTEEEQYDHARSAMQTLAGRMATFRTLDLGGDKLPQSMRFPGSVNPAMGLRSIRFSLVYRDIFRTQLRALFRAAVDGPLRILFPLISGVNELRTARAICEEVCADLKKEGIPHKADVPIGTMIETPSAALITDLIADECDFLTIGTNDLIQYTLAADRQDEYVGYLYQPLHPAILRSIRGIVDACRSKNKPLAMCGDMAGDPTLTWVLLGLGLRDLSMAPRQIPLVKSVIRQTTILEAQTLVSDIERLHTIGEVEEAVLQVVQKRFPELIDVESEAIAP